MRNNEDRIRSTAVDPSASLPTVDNKTNSSFLNFVTPTEFVELPSKGQYYPEGHSLCNQEHIEIRHMTAKDEDILTSRTLIQKGVAIDRLLQNLIVDNNIDSNELLVGDKNAVMIAARASAYGSLYEAKVQCPYCENFSNFEFNLEDIKFQKSDKEISLTENKTCVFELPISKVAVEIKFLTSKDEKQLLALSESKRKHNMADSSMTDQIKSFIVSINNEANSTLIAGFIDNMPAKDSKFLRDTYLSMVPNIDLTQHFICEHCYSETEMEVPFTANFFWPR